MLIYNIDNDTWSFGPPLNYPRSNAACASFVNEESEPSILVAGGRNTGLRMHDTTELLANGDSQWSFGPLLPRPAKDSQLWRLPNQQGVALLGGEGLNAGIWWLKIKNGTWTRGKYPVLAPTLIKVSPVMMPIDFQAENCQKADKGNILVYDSIDKVSSFYKIFNYMPMAMMFWSHGGLGQFGVDAFNYLSPENGNFSTGIVGEAKNDFMTHFLDKKTSYKDWICIGKSSLWISFYLL